MENSATSFIIRWLDENEQEISPVYTYDGTGDQADMTFDEFKQSVIDEGEAKGWEYLDFTEL